jgi:hypothetical protein
VPRGDGRLTHDLLPGEKGPQDACGVFGVWAPGEEVAKLTYYGLYALQHRGQESAGIATSDGQRLLVYKDMGLVSQVFDERSLASLRGHLAVGHCRYSTTGGSTWENAQPTLGGHDGGTVALAHNGNLINSAELRDLVEERAGLAGHPGEVGRGNTTDTALVTALLADDPDRTLEDAALDVLPRLRGAFCFVFMNEQTLYAARDPQGIRPLVLGRLDRGWVVASETAALDIPRPDLPGVLVARESSAAVTGSRCCADAGGRPITSNHLPRSALEVIGCFRGAGSRLERGRAGAGSGAEQGLRRTTGRRGRDALDIDRQVHEGYVDHGGVPLRVALAGRPAHRRGLERQLELEHALAEPAVLGQRHRVAAGEARRAQAVARLVGGPDHPLLGDVAQGVGADRVADLLDPEAGRDQLGPGREVDAVCRRCVVRARGRTG